MRILAKVVLVVGLMSGCARQAEDARVAPREEDRSAERTGNLVSFQLNGGAALHGELIIAQYSDGHDRITFMAAKKSDANQVLLQGNLVLDAAELTATSDGSITMEREAEGLEWIFENKGWMGVENTPLAAGSTIAQLGDSGAYDPNWEAAPPASGNEVTGISNASSVYTRYYVRDVNWTLAPDGQAVSGSLRAFPTGSVMWEENAIDEVQGVLVTFTGTLTRTCVVNAGGNVRPLKPTEFADEMPRCALPLAE